MCRVAVGERCSRGVLECLISRRLGSANPRGGKGWRWVPSRNFIKRVFACFHSGHARFYRPCNATGSKRHDNTIQFVVASRICAYMRARPRVCNACMHACMHAYRKRAVRALSAARIDRESYVMSLRVH